MSAKHTSSPLSRCLESSSSLRPSPGFELQSEQCLKKFRPFYGLCDSEDHWHRILDEHHRHDLGMDPFQSDPALYMIMSNGLLIGLIGGYVYDLLRAGSHGFRNLAKKTNERFQMSEDEQITCTFSGFSLAGGNDGSLKQDQHFYLQRLERLHLDVPFSEFRSMPMRPAWLANTRPACQFEISQLAHVTKDGHLAEQPVIFRRLNKATQFATDHRVSLKISTLD